MHLYHKYERHISFTAFIVGFILDNLTLTRIDVWYDDLILAIYLGLAAGGILFFHLLDRKTNKTQFIEDALLVVLFIVQLSFGALFSGYVVFYSKSAAWWSSWLFVLLIGTLLIGNEFFKGRYARLEFQVSIFFITLFSFSIFYVPIFFDTIGAGMFILSGIISLVLIALFVRILSRIVPERVHATRRKLIGSIVVLYLTFNVLYFTNIIPPVPLSLKSIGVYHSVERDGNSYVVTTEPHPWYDVSSRFWTTIHISKGSVVYVFSSVFAPTDLNTNIFHVWYYYDGASKKWIEADRVAYDITGGRGGGYRGYSEKTNVFSGEWRVDVVTGRGQLIGREQFTVVEEAPQDLITETL